MARSLPVYPPADKVTEPLAEETALCLPEMFPTGPNNGKTYYSAVLDCNKY